MLRGRAYGEADRILTLFTVERGKLGAIAKGVRRTKSHLAGRLEFSNEVLLGMHAGRNLDVVVSAETLRAHWEHIVEPERFACACLALEYVDAFCEPGLALPDVYALLVGALHAIESTPDPLALMPRFSLRLLLALGLAPPVDRCIRCGVPLRDGAWVDLEQGGFAGLECLERWREALTLDAGDLQNLVALVAPPGQGAALHASPMAAKAVRQLMAFHLGRKPKSGGHAASFAHGPVGA